MRSEKPYTKLENVISGLHRGENEKYSEKKVSKAQFYADVWRSKSQSCKKPVLRKKNKVFLGSCNYGYSRLLITQTPNYPNLCIIHTGKLSSPPPGACVCGWWVWRTQGSRCWYCIFFPRPTDYYSPSSAWWWLQVAEAGLSKCWAKRQGGAAGWDPWYKTQAVVPPRQQVEAPRYRPRAVVTLKLWMETPQHKTWVVVTSGCRWSSFFPSWCLWLCAGCSGLLFPTSTRR